MLVTEENLSFVEQHLKQHTEFGLDTETTGLEWSDRLFSIIVATSEQVFYFNFK